MYLVKYGLDEKIIFEEQEEATIFTTGLSARGDGFIYSHIPVTDMGNHIHKVKLFSNVDGKPYTFEGTLEEIKEQINESA